MTAVEHHQPNTDFHPIDIAETLAERCSWEFNRVDEDQISVSIEGAWRNYTVTLAWSGHDNMLRQAPSTKYRFSPNRHCRDPGRAM